jgi:hypothetical protein
MPAEATLDAIRAAAAALSTLSPLIEAARSVDVAWVKFSEYGNHRMTTTAPTESSAEALEYYRLEILPWLRRYATTPSAYQDANGARLLDRFAATRVREERERCAAIVPAGRYAMRSAAEKPHDL